MGQEIVYTSAPQGLRPGASGFCTVSSTAGMEPNLAEFLEGFSGYPHPYKPPDPRTKENPVNYSHVIWTIGGTRYNILSRVADAGLDHTGRTNLLAHHVALPKREAERCPGGPAWILASENFSITRWDGQVKSLPPKTPAITTEKPTEKCVAWERAAGHAGYAGVLAESVKDKGGRPVIIIYPSHLDTLPLLVEALSLLPPEKRWGVTFATFYSRIYTAFECQWRFVFHESAEARAAKRDPHSLVLDLTKGPLPEPQGGDLVKLASTGVRALAATPAVRPAAVAPASSPAAARSRRPDAPVDDYKLSPLSAPGVDLATSPATGPVINPFARARENSWAKWLPVGIAFFGGIAVTLAICVALLANRPRPAVIVEKPPQPPPLVIADVKPPPIPPPAPVEPSPENDPSKIKVAVPETPMATLPEETLPQPMPMATVSVPQPMPTPVGPPQPRRNHDYFENIDALKKTIPLPTPSLTKTSRSQHWPVKIPGAELDEVELTLRGVEAAFGAETAKSIKLKGPVDKSGSRQWQVVFEGKLRPETIATFAFNSDKQDLSFTWGKAPPSAKSDSLRMCLLQVSIRGQARTCRLLEPIEMAPLRFEREKGVLEERNLVVKSDLNYLSDRGFNTSDLRIETKLVGADGFAITGKQEPKEPGKEQTIYVFEKSPQEGPVVRLITQLLYPANSSLDHKVECKAAVGFKPNDENKPKEEKVSVEEAFEAVRSPLVLAELDAEIKKFQAKTKVFDTALKNLDVDLKKVEAEERAKIKRLKDGIKDLNEKREEMKKEQKKAADEQIEIANKTIQLSETLIQNAHKKRKDKEHDLNQSIAFAKQFEDLRGFMNQIISKCTIEYRVYVQVENEQLDLFRTPGFSAAVER